MRQLLIALVRAYQLVLSPWVGGQCRFTPTCSNYAIEALRQHGAAQGSYLGAMRIARCHPWCEGGHDPVPMVFSWAAWRRTRGPGDDALSEQQPVVSDDGAVNPPPTATRVAQAVKPPHV